MSSSAMRYSHGGHTERHRAYSNYFFSHRFIDLEWHFRQIRSFYNILLQRKWSTWSIYHLNSFFLRTHHFFIGILMLDLSITFFVSRVLQLFLLVPLLLIGYFFPLILFFQTISWIFLILIIVIVFSLKLLSLISFNFWIICLII